MSRKGNCHDNAPIESFFHLYKTELLQGLPPCKEVLAFQMSSHPNQELINYEHPE